MFDVFKKGNKLLNRKNNDCGMIMEDAKFLSLLRSSSCELILYHWFILFYQQSFINNNKFQLIYHFTYSLFLLKSVDICIVYLFFNLLSRLFCFWFLVFHCYLFLGCFSPAMASGFWRSNSNYYYYFIRMLRSSTYLVSDVFFHYQICLLFFIKN